jgi:hypothetical protein
MKSTTPKTKNLEKEPPLETELHFASGLTRSMMAGTKRITIRMGKRRFASNITVEGRGAVVHYFKHTTLLHCPLEILTREGFKTMFVALIKLREHYPELDLNTPITIVEYRITELQQ